MPACLFEQVTTYEISVYVTDSDGSSALSPTLRFPVDPALAVPNLASNHVEGDVNQTFSLSVAPQGGSGDYLSASLVGLDGGMCTEGVVGTWSCIFPTAGDREVSATVNDSNGNSATGPPVALVIDPLPELAPAGASRRSIDVLQWVTFWANATAGVGAMKYTWYDLPPGCSGVSTGQPTCAFQTAGLREVSATATDGNGGVSAPSLPVQVLVYVLPAVLVRTSSTAASVGSSVWFNASVSGGSGNDTFNWSGLPVGCIGSTQVILCQPSVAGNYAVSVAVTDSNGGVGTARTSIRIVGPSSPQASLLGPVESAGIAVIVVAGVTVLIFRRRKPPPK
jgi:hypothetical protein